MTKIIELFVKYKFLMIIILLLLFGYGAYYLGQSSASPIPDIEGENVITHQDDSSKSDDENIQNKTNETKLKQSKAKAEADLDKMAKEIEEHNKAIENDESIGTETNGTVKMAPPKFDVPKDLTVRQADFKD